MMVPNSPELEEGPPCSNPLGYFEVLRIHHFDLERIVRALALYGL
jgi:hypothetical protein